MSAWLCLVRSCCLAHRHPIQGLSNGSLYSNAPPFHDQSSREIWRTSPSGVGRTTILCAGSFPLSLCVHLAASQSTILVYSLSLSGYVIVDQGKRTETYQMGRLLPSANISAYPIGCTSHFARWLAWGNLGLGNLIAGGPAGVKLENLRSQGWQLPQDIRNESRRLLAS